MFEAPLRAYLMKQGERGLLLRWKKRFSNFSFSSFSFFSFLPPFSLSHTHIAYLPSHRWFAQVDEAHAICYYESHTDLSSPLGSIDVASAIKVWHVKCVCVHSN